MLPLYLRKGELSRKKEKQSHAECYDLRQEQNFSASHNLLHYDVKFLMPIYFLISLQLLIAPVSTESKYVLHLNVYRSISCIIQTDEYIMFNFLRGLSDLNTPESSLELTLFSLIAQRSSAYFKSHLKSQKYCVE